ncbi:DUF3237 family protein, partial [Klebsiella pneumoniae]
MIFRQFASAPPQPRHTNLSPPNSSSQPIIFIQTLRYFVSRKPVTLARWPCAVTNRNRRAIMTPELRHCFSITIQVDKPIIVSRSPQTGKRQLIPIIGGSVSGQLRGHVLPGGV